MGFLQSLWDYMLDASFFLILGLFLSGIIKTFLSTEIISKYLGKGSRWSVFKASILGVPLPLCSCSVIPTAITLRKKGASNGATSSFLISTPESGIDSITLTYALIDLPMTIIRPIGAFLTAMFAGLLQTIFNDFKLSSSEESHTSESSCCHKKEQSCHSHSEESDHHHESESRGENKGIFARIKEGLKYAFDDLISDFSLWLLIGIVLGALISYLIPPQFFEGLGGFQGRVAILMIGVPLYICASASTPIAASLIMKGLSPGMAFLFLMVGPATNISNILVLQKYIGKKGVLINILSIVLVALLISFGLDWCYDYFGWKIEAGGDHMAHEHQGIGIVRTISAIFLTFLLIKGIIKKHILKK